MNMERTAGESPSPHERYERWMGEKDDELIALMSTLEHDMVSLRKRNTKEAANASERLVGEIEDFFSEHGGEEHTASEALQFIAMENPSLILRREDPRELINALSHKRALHILFQRGDKPYPNAASAGFNLEGIEIPYTRGFGKIQEGAVVFITGFTPGKTLRVEGLSENPGELSRFKGRTRTLIRSVSGDVPLPNLKFVILRMPRHYFPEDKLTEEEIEQEPFYINRVFTFPDKEERKAA